MHTAHPSHSPGQFFFPVFMPGLTYGIGNTASSYVPGPGGPLPDPRVKNPVSGPWWGRAVRPFNQFNIGGNLGQWSPWPQQPVNNAYAVAIIRQFVPGWQKQAPTPASGF
jgi:hypothetical protein